MKSKLFTILTLVTVLFTACKKNRLDEVQGVDAKFQLNYTSDIKDLGLPFKNAQLILTNKTDGRILNGVADSLGNVTIESVTPGNYSVVATLTIQPADYLAATGNVIAQELVFNGSLETNILNGVGVLNIVLKSGTVGNWLLKQIYYGGSSTSNGAVFRDQFIEIYNNSNQILYADSLYIAQVFGKNTRVSAVDVTQPAYLSTGQFNWEKSIGMKESNANTDYVYMKTILMIPGDGKQYPVRPGKSIIIAQNALNHKASYIGANDKPVEVKDPTLTIDLSKADFEAYYGDLEGINPLASDIDNPLVPNVKVFARGGDRDMILNNNGYEAIVIFKMDAPVESLSQYVSPEITAISATSTYYRQLPVKNIIDGVDIAHTTASSRAAKRLPDTVDAGFTFTVGGAYSSHSVLRKSSKTVDGRVFLKDTNNSSQDFVSIPMPDATKSLFK